MMQRYPWLVLAVLTFVHVIAHIDRNMLLGFSPQITSELMLSNAQFGFLAGAVWVLSFGFMAPFLGSLADRTSRTRIIAGGIAVWSACTAASGFAQDFQQMAAARFFVASGEAALVPAATALMGDVFDERRRGLAAGVFFIGIPAGIGLAFLLASLFGATLGWRGTFTTLGIIGIVIAIPFVLVKDEREARAHSIGEPFLAQLRAVATELRGNPRVALTMAGFITVQFVYAAFSFYQLWLVRERGFDAASISRQIGIMQIAFGMLGALAGGVLGDRVAPRLRGGHAAVLAWLVGICGPLVLLQMFVDTGSATFYVGMAAGCFLPLSIYASGLALIQSETPSRMRATMAGVTMFGISVFAIMLGNLAAGFASDRLAQAGYDRPLTAVLIVLYAIVLSSLAMFVAAARRPARRPERLEDAPASARVETNPVGGN